MLFSALLVLGLSGQEPQASVPQPDPLGPSPSAQQIAWHGLGAYASVHIGLGTFVDHERGDESPALFAPTELDCDQWARVVAEAGLKGIVLVARGRDGFCLWPSEFTEHDVASSPWRGGRGDLLRELSEACARHGLKFGLQLAPWDPQVPDHHELFADQLREVLTRYGDLFEVRFEGGEDAHDWDLYRGIVAEHQPDAVVVGGGPGQGSSWSPVETSASIRPGWVYHPSEDSLVKDLDQLEQLWLDSTGRGTNLLLNLAVDRWGKIPEADVRVLALLGEQLGRTYAVNQAGGARVKASNVRGGQERFGAQQVLDGEPSTYWATDDGVRRAFIDLALAKPTLVDRVLLAEPVALGSRVARYRLQGRRDGLWSDLHRGTEIGPRRVLRFDPGLYQAFRLIVQEARGCPLIAEFGAYRSPARVEIHAEETVFLGATRVRFSTSTPAARVHYTLDGSRPTVESSLYTGPLMVDESCELTALAFVDGEPGLVSARLSLRAYTKESLRPPSGVEVTGAGFQRRRWDVHLRGLESLDRGRPPASQDVVEDVRAAGEAQGAAPFAQVLEGYLEAPADGIYGFFITSIDGSRLWIGDELVVDNDGLHERRELLGEIGLKAGLHPIRIESFSSGGEVWLSAAWRGPRVSKRAFRPEEISHR
jgi:alpha-L-fucosidase